MGALLGRVLTWFGGALAPLLSFKTFFGVLFMSILGVSLYNLFCELVEEVLQFALDAIGNYSVSGGSSVLAFSGVGAYLASHLKIVESFSVMVTLVLIKFGLKKIPFINW